MLFISNGARVLEKNIVTARQRMFLFSDDVAPVKDTDSMANVLSKVNASRSFCAQVKSDNTMDCVRSSGWKSKRLFYNYVPSISASSNSVDTSIGNRSVSLFDVFSRYYAIGRTGTTDLYTGTTSLLPVMANSGPIAPLRFVMVLPPFDGTPLNQLSVALTTSPSTGLTYSYSRAWQETTSLGIVTGRFTETIQTFMRYVNVTAMNVAANTATIAQANATLSGTTYFTDNATVGPRLFESFCADTVIKRSAYSETIISNSTSYAYGPYSSTTNVTDENLIFGTGTKQDTLDYAITWGMMPITGQYQEIPMYAVIVKAEEDFVQTGLASPGAKPSLIMNDYQALAIKRKFLL